MSYRLLRWKHRPTWAEVKETSRAAGNHWFSRDTMRWFGCRLEASPDRWGLFLASNQSLPRGPRVFGIYQVLPCGAVYEVPDQWPSKAEAEAHLRDIRADLRLIEQAWDDVARQLETATPADRGHFDNWFFVSGPPRPHGGLTELYQFGVSRMTEQDGAPVTHAVTYKGVTVGAEA